MYPDSDLHYPPNPMLHWHLTDERRVVFYSFHDRAMAEAVRTRLNERASRTGGFLRYFLLERTEPHLFFGAYGPTVPADGSTDNGGPLARLSKP